MIRPIPWRKPVLLFLLMGIAFLCGRWSSLETKPQIGVMPKIYLPEIWLENENEYHLLYRVPTERAKRAKRIDL